MFGTGHVGLDYLRTFHECFIIFDRGTNVFNIMTNDIEGLQRVKKVLASMRIAFNECATRNTIPLDVYQVQPPSPDIVTSAIRMCDAMLEFGRGSTAATVVDTKASRAEKQVKLCGSILIGNERAKWEDHAKSMTIRYKKIMKKALQNCVARMLFYRGRVQMRTHLGGFVFRKYYSPKDLTETPLADFIHSMRDSNTNGDMQQM